MRHSTTASVSASLADSFASDPEILRPGPAFLADLLAFHNDGGEFEDWTLGWQDDEPFNPSAEDEAAYLALGLDGGCPVGALSPEEQDILTFTMSDWDFHAEAAAVAEAMESGRPWL